MLINKYLYLLKDFYDVELKTRTCVPYPKGYQVPFLEPGPGLGSAQKSGWGGGRKDQAPHSEGLLGTSSLGPCENGLQLSSPVELQLHPGGGREHGIQVAIFHAAIVEEARSCGSMVTGASHGGNPRTRWWIPEVKGATKLKKKTYRSWLVCGTP